MVQVRFFANHPLEDHVGSETTFGAAPSTRSSASRGRPIGNRLGRRPVPARCRPCVCIVRGAASSRACGACDSSPGRTREPPRHEASKIPSARPGSSAGHDRRQISARGCAALDDMRHRARVSEAALARHGASVRHLPRRPISSEVVSEPIYPPLTQHVASFHQERLVAITSLVATIHE